MTNFVPVRRRRRRTGTVFLEAIALGIYLYGWDKVPRAVHLASGVVVAVSGAASGVLVIAVNAFMKSPWTWFVQLSTAALAITTMALLVKGRARLARWSIWKARPLRKARHGGAAI